MAYAVVADGEIVEVREPGALERKLSDGALLGAPNGDWTPELAALCGFVEIATTPRPPDTDTTTTDRTVVMVDGVPTEQWTERAKTEAEMTPYVDPLNALIAALADAQSLEEVREAAQAAAEGVTP